MNLSAKLRVPFMVVMGVLVVGIWLLKRSLVWPLVLIVIAACVYKKMFAAAAAPAPKPPAEAKPPAAPQAPEETQLLQKTFKSYTKGNIAEESLANHEHVIKLHMENEDHHPKHDQDNHHYQQMIRSHDNLGHVETDKREEFHRELAKDLVCKKDRYMVKITEEVRQDVEETIQEEEEEDEDSDGDSEDYGEVEDEK